MSECHARVLVLDAEAASRDRLVQRLEADGHAAIGVASVAEANRAAVTEGGFDLVFVDLASGDLDRIAAWLEEVRHMDPRIRVVALAADLSLESLLAAVKLQAADFKRKPLADSDPLPDSVNLATQARSRRLDERRQARRDDETIVRLKAQVDDLKERFVQQARSFEESQEVFYLDLSRMMTIIDNIMDGIIFTDREGRVTLMNPVAEDLLAVKSFIAIGKKTTEISGRDDLLRAISEDHALVMDRRKIVRTVEVHHSEQDLVYLKVMTSAVTDYKGTFAGILTVVQDVTSEFKSDQLKNQYLSIVSHELRTPLTGIKSFATMLGKGALGPLDERKGRVVEAIREQSLLLEHQIDKLINLGRLETKDFGQDLEVFPVKDLVQTATEPFRRWASDRGIEFHVTAPGSDLLVRADREDIKRTLQALVENAVKFTPDGGRVEVIVAERNEEVVFRVRDTGIGIDPRYHRRIFEKFFQVEDPLTRHHGGAGLGLCVAKGIVEAHGSRIELTSELSRGADFSFRLLRYVAPRVQESDAQSAVAGGATASATAL